MNIEQAVALHNALQDFRNSGYEFTIEIRDKELLPFTIKVEDDHLLIKRDGHIFMTITVKQDVNTPGKITIKTEETITETDLLERCMKEARDIMIAHGL